MEIVSSKDIPVSCMYCSKEVHEGNEYFYIYEPSEMGIVEIKSDCNTNNKKEIYPVCDAPECLAQLMDQKKINHIEELTPMEFINTKEKNIEKENNIEIEYIVKTEFKDIQGKNCLNTKQVSEAEESDFDEIEFLDNNFITPQTYLQTVELESIKVAFKDQEFSNLFCCNCSENFSGMYDLIQHITENHYKSDEMECGYICTLKNDCEIFSSYLELCQHIILKHQHSKPQIKIVCIHCSKEFESKVLFGKHMCTTIFTDESLKNFICEICEANYSSRRRLLFHQQFHSINPRPKVCLVCLKKFRKDKNFFNHVMFKHESAKVYFCKKCDRQFDLKEDLEKHRKTHSERNFVCQTCDAKFLDQKTLNEHVKIHSVSSHFLCHICSRAFTRRYRLSKHLLTHQTPQEGIILACNICDIVFPVREMVLEHYKEIHEINLLTEVIEFTSDRIYCCQYCEKAFKSTKSLLEHLKVHKNCEYECEFCSKRFPRYTQLKSHVRLSHTEKGVKRAEFPVQRHYLCHIENCLKSYVLYTGLNDHLKTMHFIKPNGSTANKSTCNICGEQFLNHIALGEHKRKFHAVKKAQTTHQPMICPLCSITFINESYLETHQMKMHKKDLATCTECTKIKYNIPGKEHLCSYSSKPSLACNECGKTFSKTAYLRKHIKIVHLRVINHHCEHCNKGFFSLSEKRIHERIHTNEKPLKCDMCDYAGRNYSLLSKHKDTHSLEKKYPCIVEECGKIFKRYTSLVKHRKLHHGGKNFDCDECPGKYRTQAQLTTHKRQIHSNKTDSRRRNKRKKPSDEQIKMEVITDDAIEISTEYSDLFGIEGGY